MDLNPKVAQANEIDELRKLSTERLIIWIVGRSKEISLKLTPEEIVLECWLINPEKHLLRGYRHVRWFVFKLRRMSLPFTRNWAK